MQNTDQDFYVKHTISLPKTSKLTEEIIQQLDNIFDYSPPEDYRDTLIEIYHIYISHEHDALPSNFNQMADHMFFLINFLRRVGKEMKKVDTI